MAVFLILMLATSATVLANTQETVTPLSPDEAHIGRLIECTAEEKRCFTHSRILDKKENKCYIVGSSAGCSSGKWYLDKESVFKTGKYVGKCLSQEPCKYSPLERPNAECGKFCGFDHLNEFNLFGEPTCVSHNWKSSVAKVPQPEEPELCRVPNFWSASLPSVNIEYRSFPCSQDEFLCFLDNRILWPIDGLCYELGYREPCEQQGDWLVVDEEEYLNGTGVMTPVCRPRPCPKGHLLMDFDKKCHSREEVEQVLCSGEYVLTNSHGYSGCPSYPKNVFPTERTENGTCVWTFGGFGFEAVKHIATPACPKSDTDYCPRTVIPPVPSDTQPDM